MIKVKCPGCGTGYKIPKERLTLGKSVAFSCPKCERRIVLNLKSRPAIGNPPAAQTENSIRAQEHPPDSTATHEATSQDAQQLRDRIKRSLKDIPFMPQAVIKAQKAMANPKTGGEELARILKTDQAIVSSILRTANSAYFGMSGKVSSIEKACIILGQQNIRDLIMMTGASNLLGKTMKGYGFKSGELWMHSLAASIGAKMIANKRNPDLANNAYLSGLLHDVGKIILDPYILERKAAFDEFLKNENHTILEAEKHILGFDHAEIAFEICNKWNIPEEVAIAIKNHHSPSVSKNHELSYIVHTGDYLARLCGLGYESDDILYQMEVGTAEFLGLNQEILGNMMLQVLEAVQQIGRSLK